MREKVAVIGLGYVGLPIAVALSERLGNTIGFDISQRRVEAISEGIDATGEVEPARLVASGLRVTCEPDDLVGTTFFVVTVPTPVDDARQPDLRPIESACRTIAPRLSKGAVVVFESTVYPGVTEDFCGPILEQVSGLVRGRDFHLGYSPERINPGDKEHRLETITKIVAAENEQALARVKEVYASIIDAGLHVAPSIKVAEAAKVIENTQRDLNIALMNELSVILDRMSIRSKDVLEAAGTKWNFLRFQPGLVGGHCIGVDPYYLTYASQRLGYLPEVILAGRRINDSMGGRVAERLVKLLIKSRRSVADCRVAVCGLTFKEDVPDLRNSKVPDIISELRDYGIDLLVHDPLADPDEAVHEYGITLSALEDIRSVDALVLSVPHQAYLRSLPDLLSRVAENGVIIDIKSAIDPASVGGRTYWSL
jgi:UDP-N-acetyl-D-glucosamine/UDP-N-acetyl-D-galactosamine dehydrogenase